MPNAPIFKRTRVKICGITRREDALACAHTGVDALGFVFYGKSPRAVNIQQVQDILAELPAFISTVALFLNPAKHEVEQVLDSLPIDLLQFHGQEPADFCDSFRRPYIKAIGMKAVNQNVPVFDGYPNAKALLLDSHASGEAGGTGKIFDWSAYPKKTPKPVILAGGLNPQNIAHAISEVAPYAVDVSSGVESSPGCKDHSLINEFMAQVRRADSENHVL